MHIAFLSDAFTSQYAKQYFCKEKIKKRSSLHERFYEEGL
jgi:hypothetical protein